MPGNLILGGARSGKSAYAERLAVASGLPVVYIATAEVRDAEMGRRVERHRKARPSSWRTLEPGTDLARAIAQEDHSGVCLVVDCITLWLSRLLASGAEAPSAALIQQVEAGREQLAAAIAASAAQVLVVSNELGSGVTPMGALSRVFVDEHGFTNQRIAAACERVTLMVAGCALELKPGASDRGR